MLSRILRSLADRLVLWGLALLLLFPVLPGLWRLFQPSHDPAWRIFFEAWDSGAQQPMARALLRALCAAVALAGLFLPPAKPWRAPRWTVWGTVYLGLGFLSAILAEHRFQALREWEMWALCGLVGYTVAVQWQPRMAPLLLVSAYILASFALLYSALVAIPEAVERPGGFFHHSNSFSTFCLMLLAVLCFRALGDGPDRRLAQILGGGLVGLVLASGSQTGGAVMAGVLAATALPAGTAPARRLALGLGFAAAVVAANLSGGWISLLGLPTLLLTGWALAVGGGRGPKLLRATWPIAAVALLTLAANAVLAPPEALGVGSVSRESSGLGRLEFYRATLGMAATHPLLGVGPAGFAREYPAYQSSVLYFSRFPHCLPLEVASEWGLPALLALGGLLWGAGREARTKASALKRTAGWVLLLFLLHSLTDVQTQFPYLMVLAAVALGVLAAPSSAHEPEDKRRGWDAFARLWLALGCLALLSLNLSRVAGAFDRSLATALAQNARTESSSLKALVNGFLQSAFMSDPLDSEGARLWALALLDFQPETARDMAGLALALDPGRGACLLVEFRANPPGPEQAVASYRAAAERDRINYPSFYRLWAEALRAEGHKDEALAVLRKQATFYQPSTLAALPAFRAGDLSDQLVEFYFLKAVLEDEVRPGSAEPDLRLALWNVRDNPARLARLRGYAGRLGLSGALSAQLEVLLRQVETEQRPGAVVTPLHKP